MVAKRALLVGCNYPGTNAELRGCINDVWGTQNMLKTYFGFTDADITIMIDTDPQYTKPTGRNMKAKLAEMVQQSADGDVIVFHFSGHGTQVPSDNPDDNEHDAKDEAICPCDMNLITDDDLRTIFAPLKDKPNVKLTFIADCCHSGTILDHKQVIITGPKPGGPAPPPVDVQAIQNMLAALGGGGKRDFKNRALPFNDLLGMLSQMLGQPVTQGNVRSSLGNIFGADASVKVQQYMQYIQMAHAAYQMISGKGGAPGMGGAGGAQAGCGGLLGSLLACLGGGAQPQGEGQQQPGAGGPGAAYAIPAGEPGVAPVKPAGAGSAPVQPVDHLPDEVGILITGCQDKETSADACPSGDASKAHGALSNALHTVVRSHFETQPNVPLTYRNLVISVREALAKTGFAQNPCLECSNKFADAPFVLH